MYLPKSYESFTQHFPEIMKKYQELGQTCRESGPLDAKTLNLVKLGIAVGANSRGGVMSSTRKALAAGASPQEVRQAVLQALTLTGFPNMIAAMEWASEVLDHQGA